MCRNRCLLLVRAGVVAGAFLMSASAAFAATPVPINNYAAQDSGHDQIYRNPTAADGQGNWITVWQDTTNTRVLASFSSDNATTWSAPVVVDDSETTATYVAWPEVATDRTGTWIAVWADRKSAETPTGADADVFYSRSLDNGATWSSPAPLNSNAAADSGSDGLPALACDSNGNWLAVWHSDSPPTGTPATEWDIWFSRSTDGGLTWSTAAPLNTNAAGDLSSDFVPEVKSAGNGSWLAAWRTHTELPGSSSTPALAFSRSTDGGATWTAPVSLSRELSAPYWSGGFSLAAAPDGRAIAAFESRPDQSSDYSIYVVRSQNSGETWSEPELFSRAPTGSGSPRFSPAGDGTWMATWTAPVSSDSTPGWRTIYGSISDGSSWSPAFIVASGYSAMINLFGASSYPASMSPALTSDGAGRWVCLFTFAFDPLYWPYLDYGSDLDLFAIVMDVAPRAQAATALYQSLINRNGIEDAGDDGAPAIATDSQGRRVALWQSNDSLYGTKGNDTDILVSRSTDSNQTWTSPSLLQPSGATDDAPDMDPAIATDDQGNWLALWTTSSTLTGGRLKVVSALSAVAGQTWSAPNRVNSTLPPFVTNVQELGAEIETDRTGNWVAAWHENYYVVSYIVTARTQNHGAAWSGAQRMGIGRFPNVATDRAGTWVIACEYEFCGRGYCDPPELRLARSTDHGDTWTSGIVPFPDLGAKTPDVACDGNTWILAWENEPDPQPDPDLDLAPGQLGIRSATSHDGGVTWPEPRVVSLDAATAPKVVPEAPGRWLCVWSSRPYSGFLPSERDILYARSTDNGQTWSEPVRIDRGPTYNESAAIALDGQGRPVIAWSGKNSTEAGSDYDIWFATAGSSSFTGAADWQLFD